MNLKDFETKYLFTTKIELGDNEFIELREAITQELSGFGDNDKKNLENMEKIFPCCVVNSSFVNDEGETVSGKELYNTLKKSGSLFTEILSTWINSIPFQSRLQKLTK